MATSHLQLAIASNSLLQKQGITEHFSQTRLHDIQSKRKNKSSALCQKQHLDVRHFDDHFRAPLRNVSCALKKLRNNKFCNRRNCNCRVAGAELTVVEVAMPPPRSASRAHLEIAVPAHAQRAEAPCGGN
jgi:hypothetical protein